MPLLVLRPEPGASVTMARAMAAGLDARAHPLFLVEAVEWVVPVPAAFDGLLLTSANAVRLAGEGVHRLANLPVWCVGGATAAAARAAGLSVVYVGQAGVQAVVDAAGVAGGRAMLWLAGEDRTMLTVPPGMQMHTSTVYRAAPVALAPALLAGPAVALLHSVRAAERLATLAPDKAALVLAAISPTVAAAAGHGWRAIYIAPQSDDGEMVAMAAKLCHEGF